MEVAGGNVMVVVEIRDVVFDGAVEEIGFFEVMAVVGTSTVMMTLAVEIPFERIAFEAVEAIDVLKATSLLKELKVEVNRISWVTLHVLEKHLDGKDPLPFPSPHLPLPFLPRRLLSDPCAR